jgi:hypothetical protein
MPQPLELFRQAAEALQQEHWGDVARLCDPASLERFRNEQVRMLAPARPLPALTVEQLMRHDPQMPREAAEYQVASARRHTDAATRLEREFPGIEGLEQLRAMEPAELFAVWLQGQSPGHQARMAIRDSRVPETHWQEILATADRTRESLVALGVVPDGDRVAHVVYRREFHASPDETDPDDVWIEELSPAEQELARDMAGRDFPQVATCRRQPDGDWRLLAGFDFLQLGQFMVSVGFEEPEDGVDG